MESTIGLSSTIMRDYNKRKVWDPAEAPGHTEAKGFSTNEMKEKPQKRYKAITNSRKKTKKLYKKGHGSIKYHMPMLSSIII